MNKFFKAVIRSRGLLYVLVGAFLLIGAISASADTPIKETALPSYVASSVQQAPVTALPAAGLHSATSARENTFSPQAWENASKSNSASLQYATRYLPFARWKNVSAINSPDIGFSNIGSSIGAIQLGMGRLMLYVAAACMTLVGYLLTWLASIQILGRLAVPMDGVFAKTATGLLGDSGAVSFRGLSTFGAVIIVALLIASIGWFTSFGGVRRGSGGVLGKMAWVIMASVLFMIMGSQSMKNHSDMPGGNKSPVASASDDAYIRGETSIDANNPRNWAVASPGWFVALTSQVGNAVVNLGNNLIGSIGEASNKIATPPAENNTCAYYVEGLHSVYKDSYPVKNKYANSSTMLLSYSQLTEALYFQTYMLAAYGDSMGAGSSWCRSAEMQAGSPTGDQIFVARKARLYQDFTSKVTNSDGSWKDDKAIVGAVQFFGPYALESDSTNKAVYYFAACQWSPGENVKLNEEWAAVAEAKADTNSLAAALWKYSIAGQITNFIKNNVFSGDGVELIDAKDCQEVIPDDAQKMGFAKDLGDKFNYHENRDTSVFGLFGSKNSTSIRYFQVPIASGDYRAYNMYLTSQGLNVFESGWFCIIALISMLMIAKYTLPLALGAMVAQAIAGIVIAFSVIFFLLLIIPIDVTRRIAKKAFGHMVWGTVAFGVLSLGLQMAFAMATVFRSLMWSPNSNGFEKVITIGVATIAAFWAAQKVFAIFFAIDTSSMKAAVKSAATSSGNRFLGDMGWGGGAPILHAGREKGMASRAASGAARAATNAGIGGAATALKDRLGLGGDTKKAENEKAAKQDASKKKTSDSVTKVTGDQGKKAAEGLMKGEPNKGMPVGVAGTTAAAGSSLRQNKSGAWEVNKEGKWVPISDEKIKNAALLSALANNTAPSGPNGTAPLELTASDLLKDRKFAPNDASYLGGQMGIGANTTSPSPFTNDQAAVKSFFKEMDDLAATPSVDANRSVVDSVATSMNTMRGVNIGVNEGMPEEVREMIANRRFDDLRPEDVGERFMPATGSEGVHSLYDPITNDYLPRAGIRDPFENVSSNGNGVDIVGWERNEHGEWNPMPPYRAEYQEQAQLLEEFARDSLGIEEAEAMSNEEIVQQRGAAERIRAREVEGGYRSREVSGEEMFSDMVGGPSRETVSPFVRGEKPLNSIFFGSLDEFEEDGQDR